MDAHADLRRGARLWFSAWLGDDGDCVLAESVLADSGAADNARAAFDRKVFRLPRQIIVHHRACSAHFYAHRRFGDARFPVAKLRPIQIVLISLFEDARVEQLAMRERPGLRRLWQPYIDALATDGGDVAALLRQLVAALFEPARPVMHPWIDKARRLFCERHGQWHDPALSRELGNLLGNDIGQMRLQFNWKSYVVEPVYRDDHRGLWQDDHDPQPRDDERSGIRIDNDALSTAAAPAGDDVEACAGEIGEWMAFAASAPAAAVTLPEWDYARGFYRADWVSACELAPQRGDAGALRQLAALDISVPARRKNVATLRRRRRWHDGDTLDLDACIRHAAESRLGQVPDARIYRRIVEMPQPRALLILIDTSLSMNDGLSIDSKTANATALDRAKMAAWRLAQNAIRCGDALAVYGFCSNGRHELRMTPIKDFSEVTIDNRLGAEFLSGLSGLQGAYSTRLGAALRYARRQFADHSAVLREIVVFGDGEAGDIDIVDPYYLNADAVQARRELQNAGISVSIIDVLRNDKKVDS